jgi:hypothetical protein
LTLTLALALAGCGQSTVDGHLLVNSASIEHGGDQSVLQVELDHEFGPVLLEAMHSGVPIRYVWSLELLGEDRWPSPRKLAERDGYLEIGYRSVTRWYTLEGLNPNNPIALPDIEEAERVLGQMKLPLTDLDWPTPVRMARFRIELDVGNLPPPLRLPAYLSEQWRRDSGWYHWQPPSPPAGT